MRHNVQLLVNTKTANRANCMAATQCLVGWAAALLKMSEPTLMPALENWNQVNIFCNSVIIDLKACTKQMHKDKVIRQYVKLDCIVYKWLLGVWQTDYLTNYCFNIFQKKVLVILDFLLPATFCSWTETNVQNNQMGIIVSMIQNDIKSALRGSEVILIRVWHFFY